VGSAPRPILRRTPTDLVRTQHYLLCGSLIFATSAAVHGQTPPQKPPAKPSTKTTAKPAADARTGPQQTKHYPILVIAHGNEPAWSLRLGMKGPERLDRAGYPPIVLEPADVVRSESGLSWTYNAKDTAAGAVLSVKLFREPCSDTMSDTKYTFTVMVDHAQIGTLNGCGQSVPDKFPEFRKKNQLDPADNADADDKDKDKKTGLDPITNFKPPIAIAYLNPAGKVMFKRGATTRLVAPDGSQLAISHDGNRLLYTHEDKAADRAIRLYDFTSGKTTALFGGNVQQASWSPDDTRFAFLKFVDGHWRLWTAPIASPEKAAPFYAGEVASIAGWADSHTIIVDDLQKLSWVGEDGTVQREISEKDLFGDSFGFSSANTVRVHPLNPDLLLVDAEWIKTPPGTLLDEHMARGFGFFLYEIRTKRRVLLSPLNMLSEYAAWSRDGLQIYFTGTDASRHAATYRIFWDGSGLRRYLDGTELVIGQ
jgi:uncharacterized membrane protein